MAVDGALSKPEDVWESMGLHCVGRPFVADSVGSCSHWCKTVKDLSGHENSLCSVGREEQESYKKKMIFQQIFFCKCTDENDLFSWKYMVY